MLVPFKNGLYAVPMVLFSHSVQKTKYATHKNISFDGKC